MKFGQVAKAIFLQVYNDPTVRSQDIHKAITIKLHEAKELDSEIELNAEIVRVAFEGKLGLNYRNRPRTKKEVIEISFDDDSSDLKELKVPEVEQAPQQQVSDEKPTLGFVNVTTRQEPLDDDF